jgi:hypothetical protein
LVRANSESLQESVYPEPLSTPFNSSKFQAIINSCVKLAPSPILAKDLLKGKKKLSSMENLPLVKAFEKQRNLSTSTVNVTRPKTGFNFSPFVEPLKVAESSSSHPKTPVASTSKSI